jgi:hypothetical protein
MCIFLGISKQLGRYETGLKSVARIDVDVACTIKRHYQHPFWVKRTHHLRNLSQKRSQVYTRTRPPCQQALVELCRDLDARVDAVKQHTNLFRREGLVGFGNGLSFKANKTAETRQIIRDPMVRFGHADKVGID